MPQLARANHFVSQKLLKQWSIDGSNVWAYRILVSHQNVPEWTVKPIRGVAWRENLYTTSDAGTDTDEFEHWIESNYETPAHETLEKVVNNRPLTSEDRERLALFLAAQDVRTPTTYVELTERWEKEMPALINETLQETVRSLENSGSRSRSPALKDELDPFRDLFAITVNEPADEESLGSIKAEVVVGRRFWLASQKHLLTRTAKILRAHKWSIVEPAPGFSWFVTDHPVLRLNYYKNDTHDLKGGWGNPGSELMMPLSPRHLLFTHVGQDAPDRIRFSEDQSAKIQRFLAERAHRWIFAQQPVKRVAWLRPRHVDAEAFKAEEREWADWHDRQNAVEV